MSGRRLIAIIVGIVGLLLLVVIAYLLLNPDDEPPESAAQPSPTPVEGEVVVGEEEGEPAEPAEPAETAEPGAPQPEATPVETASLAAAGNTVDKQTAVIQFCSACQSPVGRTDLITRLSIELPLMHKVGLRLVYQPRQQHHNPYRSLPTH